MTCGSYPLSWGAKSLLTLHKPFFSVKDVSLLFMMQILPSLMFLFVLVYSSFVILVLWWLLFLFGCLDANSELLCNPSASLYNLFECFVIL